MTPQRITITFDSQPSKYERDIESAKTALLKVKKAEIDEGSVAISGVKIKIEKLSGGK